MALTLHFRRHLGLLLLMMIGAGWWLHSIGQWWVVLILLAWLLPRGFRMMR